MAILKHICRILCIFLMLICFSLSLISVKQMAVQKQLPILVNSEQPYDGKTAIQMQEQEVKQELPISFLVWGQTQNRMVKNEEFYRSRKVSLITVCGNTELLVEVRGYLDMYDKDGCLIDEATARELFGSTTVTGNTVVYEDRRYIIRGLLKNVTDTMIIQADSTTKAIMDRIAVGAREDEQAENVLAAFLNRQGIGSKETNIGICYGWAKLVVTLLPLLMGGFIIIPIIKKCLSKKDTPVIFFLYIGMAAGLIMILFWIIQMENKIPLHMIPTKWSDFDFWERMYKQKLMDMGVLIKNMKSPMEMGYVSHLFNVLRYSFFAVILFFISLRQMEIKNLKSLFLNSITFLLLSFCAIVMNQSNGQLISDNRMIWFCMIYYIFGRWLLCYLGRRDELNPASVQGDNLTGEISTGMN